MTNISVILSQLGEEGRRAWIRFKEVMARLEAMPFENLLQPRFPDDPQKRPLIEWVMGNTSDHIKEHRLTIEKAL